MKHTLLLLAAYIFATTILQAQDKTPARKYSTYYYQRASLFEKLPVTSEDILFVGNSLTDGAEWAELFQNKHIKNRGISGDMTDGVYDRLPALLQGKPAQIFLLIGTNDIPRGKSVEDIAAGIHKIIKKIKQDSPRTQLFVQSLLPLNPQYNMFPGHVARWEIIPDINKAIEQIAREENLTYIDLFSRFADSEGKLKGEYTNDGLHLLGSGYLLWKEIITPYLKGE